MASGLDNSTECIYAWTAPTMCHLMGLEPHCETGDLDVRPTRSAKQFRFQLATE